MMRVSGPGGITVQFPDGTPPETIDKVMSEATHPSGMANDRIAGAFDAAAPMAGRQVTSATQAALRGAGQGVTSGFADEMAAGQQASGLSPLLDVIPGMGLQRAMIGGIRSYFSPDASKAYDQKLEAERRMNTIAGAEHPVANTAGEFAGMVASAPIGGGLAKGIGPLARAGRAALTGAGQSALYGAGTGEDLQGRVGGAAVQGALGGVMGAGGSALVDAGAAAAPYLRNVFPMGAINPTKEAAKKVAGALVSDAGGDINLARQNVTQVPRMNAAGVPMVIADAGDGATQRLGRAAGNLSPQADQLIRSTTQDRFHAQGNRTDQFIKSVIGNVDSVDAQEALQTAARQANRPAYARAYAQGDTSIWSPTLERLTSSPAVVDAMRGAAQRGKDRAVTEGFGGFNPGVTVDPSGIVSFRRGPTGQPTYPNLQYWDYVKRELDDSANAAQRAGRKEEATTLGNLAGQLRTELDNRVPAYSAARAGAARFFGASDALTAGQQFLGSRMSNSEARQALAKMSPAEKQLFAMGYASQFSKAIREMGDSRNILNSQFVNSTAARERNVMALGQQNANALETHLRVEQIMDRMRTAMGNSTTVRQFADIAAFGTAAGGVGYLTGQYQPSVGAMIAAGARYGKISVNRRVAEEVGRMLMSDDPQVLEKGLKAVASNQSLLNAIRSAQALLTKGAVPAMASAAMTTMGGPGAIYGPPAIP